MYLQACKPTPSSLTYLSIYTDIFTNMPRLMYIHVHVLCTCMYLQALQTRNPHYPVLVPAICTELCTYIHRSIYIHAHVHVLKYISRARKPAPSSLTYLCIQMYTQICIDLCTYMYTYVYLYISTGIYLLVLVYIYVYIMYISACTCISLNISIYLPLSCGDTSLYIQNCTHIC